MEPEDREILQKIMTSYQWPRYDDEVTIPAMDGLIHRVKTSSGKPDLSEVSTRDLLNECYRRRAIEKFTYTQSIDEFALQHDPEMRAYALRELSRGVWETFVSNSKFYADAIAIKEEINRYQQRHEFAGEIYVCKHPTKVKK